MVGFTEPRWSSCRSRTTISRPQRPSDAFDLWSAEQAVWSGHEHDDHEQRRPARPLAFAAASKCARSGTMIRSRFGGSGAIGVEFAYVMKNFGVDVTIVEFADFECPHCKTGRMIVVAIDNTDDS